MNRSSFYIRPNNKLNDKLNEEETGTRGTSRKNIQSKDLESDTFENTNSDNLIELASLQKPRLTETETFLIYLPIPIGVFWRRFLADNAEYSCLKFYAEEGHKEMDLEKWEPNLKKGR
jgi:hypothetical protein